MPKVMVWLAGCTVNVNDWVASGAMPLVAVIVRGNMPVAAGVPDSTPADESVTPEGRLPVKEKVGDGLPLAVTLNVLNEL